MVLPAVRAGWCVTRVNMEPPVPEYVQVQSQNVITVVGADDAARYRIYNFTEA